MISSRACDHLFVTCAEASRLQRTIWASWADDEQLTMTSQSCSINLCKLSCARSAMSSDRHHAPRRGRRGAQAHRRPKPRLARAPEELRRVSRHRRGLMRTRLGQFGIQALAPVAVTADSGFHRRPTVSGQ